MKSTVADGTAVKSVSTQIALSEYNLIIKTAALQKRIFVNPSLSV